MNRFRSVTRLAAAVGLMLALPAVAAELQIFTSPGFGGAAIELRGETADVAGIDQGHFNNQASSLVVNDRWEICTEANYRGECVIMAPGRYSTLNAPIRWRIGSARPLGVKLAEEVRNHPVAPPPPVYREEVRREPVPPPHERARYARGSADIFPGAEYRGRPMRVDRDQPVLDDFAGGTASLVIHEGVWQLCSEADYRGRCRTLEPGRYPAIRGGLASLRQLR